jgi:glucokinase
MKGKHMIVGLDLGGTNVRGTWFLPDGQSGEVILRSRPKTLEGTCSTLLDLIDDISSQAEGSISGIGVASAGPLDHQAGAYLRTTNMPELDFFPLAAFLEEKTGAFVVMENDAQAAAVGEVSLGGLRGVDDAVVLTLGTGLGSGVILEGRLWRAAHHTGPELGHLYMGPLPRVRCGCGQFGCAETWLRKRALVDILVDQGVKLQGLRQVHELLDNGHTGALKAMGIYGRRLGVFISMLMVTFGVKHVGISGGLSRFSDWFLSATWDTLKRRLKDRNWLLPVSIVPSPNPDMSALWGMVRLCQVRSDQTDRK